MLKALGDIATLLNGTPEVPPPLRGTLDLLSVGLCVARMDGEMVFLNQTATVMLGVGVSERTSNEWSSEYGIFYGPRQAMLPPDELPLVRALQGQTVQAQRVFMRNAHRPEGHWLLCTATPIQDAQGQQTGALVLFEPTTAEPAANPLSPDGAFTRRLEALQHCHPDTLEEDTVLRLLERATDGIWDWNLRTNETYFSPRWKRALGYGQDELQDTLETWRALMFPEDLPRAERALRAHLKQGQPFDLILRYIRKDGSVAWMRTRGEAMQGDTGRWERIIGIHIDLTQLKEAEAALEVSHARDRQLNAELEERVTRRTERLNEANKALIEKNVDLEQFAYVASHDLQEPLRKILSFGPLLAERLGPSLDEKSAQYMQIMIEGAQRLRQLIQDLLAYSRYSQLEHTTTHTELMKPLRLALHDLSTVIDDPDSQIIIDGPLPIVIGSPSHLAQVLQNILGNAAKYRSDERPLRVRISTRSTETEHIIAIADNGIGIEPQYFERIFEVFQRLHSRNRYSGTGIGLAICKRIIEQYDGRIWVESTHGVGSTFFIALPIPTESPNAPATPDRHPAD